MEKTIIQILSISIFAIILRLWGNLSVLVLTGINPRKLPMRKYFMHWTLSFGFATFILFLYKKTFIMDHLIKILMT